jgi:hypothetical protein|tara:strand:- start:2482 stop:2865 length:384 start_codon:yes stop_codon:yes gene_type:complete
MDKKTFDIIIKHKVEKVCKLYFELQEQYKDEFEKISLFDSDWNRMVMYAKGEYDEIDSSDMTMMNRIWKTYNKYKKEGTVYNEWEEIDYYLKEGQKIQAIKEYRNIHKSSLREAKDAVDERHQKLGL